MMLLAAFFKHRDQVSLFNKVLTETEHGESNFRKGILSNLSCCCITRMSLASRDYPHCKEIWIYVFPEKEFARPQSQFAHSCVCQRSIYSHFRPTYFPAFSRIGIPITGLYTVNRSHEHKCRNWDWSRAVTFQGIFVSNFRYWIFAVHNSCCPYLNAIAFCQHVKCHMNAHCIGLVR
jgi:hypothetical protein